MIHTLSDLRLMTGAAIGQPYAYALGNNRDLTFSLSSTGGRQWRINRTPMPDRMSVQTFAGTVTDTSSRPCLGARIGLGFLTGSPEQPVYWLKTGIVGTKGDFWIRADGPFRTDFGLCMMIPDYYWSSSWYFKAIATFNAPRQD